jgi:hypothetical protein
VKWVRTLVEAKLKEHEKGISKTEIFETISVTLADIAGLKSPATSGWL